MSVGAASLRRPLVGNPSTEQVVPSAALAIGLVLLLIAGAVSLAMASQTHPPVRGYNRPPVHQPVPSRPLPTPIRSVQHLTVQKNLAEQEQSELTKQLEASIAQAKATAPAVEAAIAAGSPELPDINAVPLTAEKENS